MSVFAANNICARVANREKNSVSRNASAIPKVDKCLMAWASAITTCFGKSAIAAINLPKVN